MDRVTSFAKRIKEYREDHDLTLAEMEKITGVPAQTINRYELEQRHPKIDVAISIAEKLGVNALWLQGYDVPVINELWEFPIISKIAAGYDHEPIMSYTGERTVIPAIEGYNKDELIVCEIFGTSMWPQFIEGDKVVVRLTPSVNSGDLACVMVGNEATIKKVVYQKEGETEQFMDLVPTNPEFQTKRITGEDLNSCRVIGKVIKLLRDV